MLDLCAAIHMAPNRDWSARSGEIMREAGVGEACLFLSIDDIARRLRKTPVQFLIISCKVDEDELRATIAAVRGHHEPGVRFMPIIIFTRDGGPATALHYLKMGCDDIIAFPSTHAQLTERLGQHVGRKFDFVHMGAYFGRDRPGLREGEDGEGVSEHFTVLRDPAHGIKIVSQSKKAAKPVAQAAISGERTPMISAQ